MTAVSYDTRTRTRKSSFTGGASSYFSTDKYGNIQTFFEGTYNRDGLLIAEKSRAGVNKEYRYDKLGRIVEVKTGGDVTV